MLEANYGVAELEAVSMLELAGTIFEAVIDEGAVAGAHVAQSVGTAIEVDREMPAGNGDIGEHNRAVDSPANYQRAAGELELTAVVVAGGDDQSTRSDARVALWVRWLWGPSHRCR